MIEKIEKPVTPLELNSKINEIIDNIAGKSIGEIISVACGSSYVPDGCLPCDGAEYDKSLFPDLWSNYLTTNLLNTCTYDDYATDLETYGQCGKFGVKRTYNINCSNDDLTITGEYNSDEAKIFIYNHSGTTTLNENVVLTNLIPTNGVVNNFSLSSYFEIQNITSDENKTFIISLITGNDIDTNQGIAGSDMSIAISGGSLGYNSLSGSGEFKPVVTISENQHILIKIITGENSDKVYYSLDGGVSWKLLNENMHFATFDKEYIFGKGVIGTGENSGTQTTYPFLGSIDLLQSYFLENSVIIPFYSIGTWTPNIEDYGLIVYGLTNDGDSITVSNIAGRFKAPTIKDGAVIQQALSDSELGKSYNAGLPNITGTMGTVVTGSGYDSYNEGALYLVKNSSGSNTFGSTSGSRSIYGFDASLSDSIYGASDTVQPNAVALRYFVVVANGQINESMMDWSAWASGLNGKGNRDGSNWNASIKNMYGKWVNIEPVTLWSATAVGTYEIDLSEYLPNDKYNYEILIWCKASRNSSSDASMYITTSMWQKVLFLVTSANAYAISSLNVFPVGTDRKITIDLENCAFTSQLGLKLFAYRRMGTNE